MVVTGRTRFTSPEKCSGDDHHDVWIPARQLPRHDGPGTTTNASGVAPATRQINMVAALYRSRCASVVVVIAADVDPLQSVGRPHSAPAAIVGGVGEGRANERKAMEAVMEERAVMEAVPERER